MNSSLLGDLWNKVFKAGNPLWLFLGLNVLVFLFLNGMNLFVALRIFPATFSAEYLLMPYLQLPANALSVLFKPWTLVTYMFTQVSFFHLLFNMLWLYWLGMIFLDFLSKKQFVFIYFFGGLAGAALYLLAYALVPVFSESKNFNALIGSSAAVSAIVFATATLVPDFSIRMLFFGNVRLKYLALVFIILDLLGVGGGNAGGSIAHIGGALSGFFFVRQLQKGNDWSRLLERKRKKQSKHRMRVVSTRTGGAAASTKKPTGPPPTNQEVIDQILDKISQSGYDSLSKSEKDALFRVSKQDQK